MSEQRPECIREHVGKLYQAVFRIITRHDPLGLIKQGAPPGEYALPVGTIARRIEYEFTPPSEVVYEEFERWTKAAGGMYERLLGPPESFREIADEVAALEAKGIHLKRVDRIRVYYTLEGEFDPDAIQGRIGIPADRARRKGERAWPDKPLPLIKESYVQYGSGLSNAEEAEDHLAALLRRLRPAWATLKDLGQEFTARVSFVLATDEGTGPAMGLSVGDMRALQELNAAVDVDIYCFT